MRPQRDLTEVAIPSRAKIIVALSDWLLEPVFRTIRLETQLVDPLTCKAYQVYISLLESSAIDLNVELREESLFYVRVRTS